MAPWPKPKPSSCRPMDPSLQALGTAPQAMSPSLHAVVPKSHIASQRESKQSQCLNSLWAITCVVGPAGAGARARAGASPQDGYTLIMTNHAETCCLCFEPGLDILGPRSLDPKWKFHDLTRLGDRDIWDTRAVTFPRNPNHLHAFSYLWGSLSCL